MKLNQYNGSPTVGHASPITNTFAVKAMNSTIQVNGEISLSI